MRKINVVLIFLAIASASSAYADCPSEEEVEGMVETGGQYTVQGLGGKWMAIGIPKSGISPATLKAAVFKGADGRGSITIFAGGDDRPCSTCAMLHCNYETSGGFSFSMSAPADMQYKPIGTNWGRVKDKKSHNTYNYTCQSANNMVGDCPFNKFP